jgi:hypothetical protein
MPGINNKFLDYLVPLKDNQETIFAENSNYTVHFLKTSSYKYKITLSLHNYGNCNITQLKNIVTYILTKKPKLGIEVPYILEIYLKFTFKSQALLTEIMQDLHYELYRAYPRHVFILKSNCIHVTTRDMKDYYSDRNNEYIDPFWP